MPPVVDPSTVSTVSGVCLTIATWIFDSLALASTWVEGQENRGGAVQARVGFKPLQLCPPEPLPCLSWSDVNDRDLCCDMVPTYNLVAALMFLALFIPFLGTLLAGYIVYKQQHWRNATLVAGGGNVLSMLAKVAALVFLGMSDAYNPEEWEAQRWTYAGAVESTSSRSPTTGMVVTAISLIISLCAALIFLCYTKVDMCNDVYLPGDNLRNVDPRVGVEEDDDDSYGEEEDGVKPV